jgi:hypothetical protein
VNVNEIDYYTFFSESNIVTHGYLYKNNFDPNNPYINLLIHNVYGCVNDQFKLTAALESNSTYILVVTTYYSNTTGAFSVFASGPNNINLKGNNEGENLDIFIQPAKVFLYFMQSLTCTASFPKYLNRNHFVH